MSKSYETCLSDIEQHYRRACKQKGPQAIKEQAVFLVFFLYSSSITAWFNAKNEETWCLTVGKLCSALITSRILRKRFTWPFERRSCACLAILLNDWRCAIAKQAFKVHEPSLATEYGDCRWINIHVVRQDVAGVSDFKTLHVNMRSRLPTFVLVDR